MLDHGTQIRVGCTKCDKVHDLDIAALAEKVGRDYSLINRRCRCRITPGCRGWNRFHYFYLVYRPLWEERMVLKWMERR